MIGFLKGVCLALLAVVLFFIVLRLSLPFILMFAAGVK